MVTLEKSHENTSGVKTMFARPPRGVCHMVDLTLLDMWEDNICRLQPRLNIEKVWIFGKHDERIIKINANLIMEEDLMNQV